MRRVRKCAERANAQSAQEQSSRRSAKLPLLNKAVSPTRTIVSPTRARRGAHFQWTPYDKHIKSNLQRTVSALWKASPNSSQWCRAGGAGDAGDATVGDMIQHVVRRLSEIIDKHFPQACFRFATVALTELKDSWPHPDAVPRIAKDIFNTWPDQDAALQFVELRSKYMFVLLKEVSEILNGTDGAGAAQTSRMISAALAKCVGGDFATIARQASRVDALVVSPRANSESTVQWATLWANMILRLAGSLPQPPMPPPSPANVLNLKLKHRQASNAQKTTRHTSAVSFWIPVPIAHMRTCIRAQRAFLSRSVTGASTDTPRASRSV